MVKIGLLLTSVNPGIVLLILVIVLGILIKIIKNYHKYGKNIFSSFKNYTETSNNEFVEMIISKHNVKYIIKDNNYILITKSGIFVVYFFDYIGVLSGNTNDDNLILHKSNKEIKLPNILKMYEINENVTKIILLSEEVIMDIKNTENYYIVRLKNFYNFLGKELNNEIITETEVNNLYKKIGDAFGNNKN